jgi:hypothetical protein
MVLLQPLRQDGHKFSGRNDLDSLKLTGEIARIACNNVFGAAFKSALKHHVIVGVAGGVEMAAGLNQDGRLANGPQ